VTASKEAADLDACEQEPLAFSGRIQDVGALIGTAPGDDALSCFSDNLGRWFELPLPTDELRLNDLFADDCDYFRYRRRAIFEGHHFVVRNVLTNRGIEGDLLLSEHPTVNLYEFEPKIEPRVVPHSQAMLVPVTHDSHSLARELRIDTLLRRIHALTSYPKIMLYRFLSDGSGEVVAELNSEDLDNYQGLRFPASDIPRIARNLYVDNPFRLIFDTQGRESSVQAAGDDTPDLSRSCLRSVSPVHVEYLGNMGVRSSASFPVRVMGRLWGLVALHAVEATAIPIEQRLALQQLVEQELSRKLMDIRITAEHRRFNASSDLLHDSAVSLARVLQGGHGASPERSTESLRRLISSDEVLLRIDGRTQGQSSLVGEDELEAIIEVARAQALRGQFSTESLHLFLDQDEDFRQRASGLLYATTGIEKRGALEVLWLRSEQAKTVTWAGRPEKLRRQVDGVERISPRQSFAAWSAQTAGQSLPWESSDVLMASKLIVQVMAEERRQA